MCLACLLSPSICLICRWLRHLSRIEFRDRASQQGKLLPKASQSFWATTIQCFLFVGRKAKERKKRQGKKDMLQLKSVQHLFKGMRERLRRKIKRANSSPLLFPSLARNSVWFHLLCHILFACTKQWYEPSREPRAEAIVSFAQVKLISPSFRMNARLIRLFRRQFGDGSKFAFRTTLQAC